MKKYIILFGVIFLIITTSIVKSSTRQLEKKNFYNRGGSENFRGEIQFFTFGK